MLMEGTARTGHSKDWHSLVSQRIVYVHLNSFWLLNIVITISGLKNDFIDSYC